jgi:hypothetical protein
LLAKNAGRNYYSFMGYEGTERRAVVQMPMEYIDIIARVDERTKTILETMPTKSEVLAAMNKAECADKKIDEHIGGHKAALGTWIAAIAGMGGLAAGIAAILSIPKGSP